MTRKQAIIAALAGFFPAMMGYGQKKSDVTTNGRLADMQPLNINGLASTQPPYLAMYFTEPNAKALEIHFNGETRTITAAEVWEALK